MLSARNLLLFLSMKRKKVNICENEWNNIGNMAKEIRRIASDDVRACNEEGDSMQGDLPARLEENYMMAPSAGDAYIFDLALD